MLEVVLSLAAALLIAVGVAALYVVYSVLRPAKHSFHRYRPTPAHGGKVVVCTGDSLTQATVSGDWLCLLRARFPEFIFVNAGVNGDCAYNVAQKAQAIRNCNPAAVVVLVGTNDAKAEVKERWGRQSRLWNGLPQEPSYEFFRSSLSSALGLLTQPGRDGSSPPPLAVLTLPMLGEDPAHVGNEEVIPKYNRTLQDVVAAARQRNSNIEILDLNAALWERAKELRTTVQRAQSQPPPVEKFMRLMWHGATLHYLLRWSWDSVGRRHGQVLMPDALHLNDTGAAVIGRLVAEWLQRAAGGPSP